MNYQHDADHLCSPLLVAVSLIIIIAIRYIQVNTSTRLR